MRVLQIGNFEPPHSTENELYDALNRLAGVNVVQIQEHDLERWLWVCSEIRHRAVDLVLWTSTRSLAAQIPEKWQYEMLRTAAEHGVPTVGYHLDRWWGLHANRRQEQMFGPDGELRPFFLVQALFTADGGHQQQWGEIGVNHIWMPPGVSERWCYLAEPDPRYDFDVVFVGGWFQYGHTEWTHREQMINKVHRWYGDRFKCFPERGQPRITMGELNTIYASAKVVVGDSCLVPKADGSPMTHYCSDRVPETLGRGGMLIHPRVEGIDELFGDQWVWTLNDWDELWAGIETLLEFHAGRTFGSDGAMMSIGDYRRQQIDNIKAEHTYTHRMREVLKLTTDWSD